MTNVFVAQYVNSVAVLADGRIASGSDDVTVRLWNTATGACDLVLLEGHTSVSEWFMLSCLVCLCSLVVKVVAMLFASLDK